MPPGEQLVDLVHVDDVSEAMIQAWRLMQRGELQGRHSFGLSSGSPLSLRALARVWAEALDRPMPVEFGARPDREREVMTPWKPSRQPPGWMPSRSLVEGLAGLAGRDRTSEVEAHDT